MFANHVDYGFQFLSDFPVRQQSRPVDRLARLDCGHGQHDLTRVSWSQFSDRAFNVGGCFVLQPGRYQIPDDEIRCGGCSSIFQQECQFDRLTHASLTRSFDIEGQLRCSDLDFGGDFCGKADACQTADRTFLTRDDSNRDSLLFVRT